MNNVDDYDLLVRQLTETEKMLEQAVQLLKDARFASSDFHIPWDDIDDFIGYYSEWLDQHE